jgi:hypothetical protein
MQVFNRGDLIYVPEAWWDLVSYLKEGFDLPATMLLRH